MNKSSKFDFQYIIIVFGKDLEVQQLRNWNLIILFTLLMDLSLSFGQDIDGKDVSLSKFKGKVVLIVNVASKWYRLTFQDNYSISMLVHLCSVFCPLLGV